VSKGAVTGPPASDYFILKIIARSLSSVGLMVLIDDSDGIKRGCPIEVGDDKDGQAASFFLFCGELRHHELDNNTNIHQLQARMNIL
jgi:hypothetical protein